MEFTISRSDFLEVLQKVRGVADDGGTVPILSNVLIEADTSKEHAGIWISATDLKTWAKGFCNAQVTKEGRFTINARILFDIVKELPDDEDIYIESNEVADLCFNMSCGSYKTKLQGLSDDDFPAFPSYKDDHLIKFKSVQLKEMIKKTGISISSDEYRRAICGTFFKLEGDAVEMVSTDGYRLSYIRNKNEKTVDSNVTVIIPRNGTSGILKGLDGEDEDVMFGVFENNVVFKKSSFTLVSRIIDEQFPNYNVFITSYNNNKYKVVFNRHELIHALKRVSVVSDVKSKMVNLIVGSNCAEITGKDAITGDAREKIEIKYEGEELTVGLNSRFLLDVLSVIDDDDVIISINDSTTPLLITSPNKDDYKHILMPMRLT